MLTSEIKSRLLTKFDQIDRRIEDRSGELKDFKNAVCQLDNLSLLGYFGIGGIGKSTLLKEFARFGKFITPYVIYIDLGHINSRLILVNQIIQQLEQGPTLKHFSFISQRLAWLSKLLVSWFPRLGIFFECNKIVQAGIELHLGASTQISTTTAIEAQHSARFKNIAQHTHIDIHGDDLKAREVERREITVRQSTHQLMISTRKLPVYKKDRKNNITVQVTPLIFIFDTLEKASVQIFDWLQDFVDELNMNNVVFIFGGRNYTSQLTPGELSTFPEEIAYNYLTSKNVRPDLHKIIYQVSGGNPLCLDLAAKYAGNNPEVTMEDFTDYGGGERELILGFLYVKYLNRLKQECEKEENENQQKQLWQIYYALQYAVILRRFNVDTLKAVLSGLEYPDNVFSSEQDFVKTWQEIRQHSFIKVSRDGAEFHPLIRHLTIDDLRTSSPKTYRRLHELAMGFYKESGDKHEEFYHYIGENPKDGFEKLKADFSRLLESNELEACNELINLADDSHLTIEYRGQLNLMKVDLLFASRKLEVMENEILTQVIELLLNCPEDDFGQAFDKLESIAMELVEYKRYDQVRILISLTTQFDLTSSYVNRIRLIEFSLLSKQIIDDKRFDKLPLLQPLVDQVIEGPIPDDRRQWLASVIHWAYDQLIQNPNLNWINLVPGYDWLIEYYQGIGDNDNLIKSWKAVGNTYLKHIDKIFQINLHDVVHYSQKGIEAAQNADDVDLEATILQRLGYAYLMTGDSIQAKDTFERSLRLNYEVENENGILTSLAELAQLEYLEGNYSKAQRHCEESLKIAEEYNQPVFIAHIYNTLGAIHTGQEDFGEALSYYEKAIELYDKLEMYGDKKRAEISSRTARDKVSKPDQVIMYKDDDNIGAVNKNQA